MDTAAAGRAVTTRAAIVLLAVAAGWLMFLGLATATALAEDPTAHPPVLNESFESVPGLPPGWKFVEFTQGNSAATIESGAAAEGTHFLRIVSRVPNHARVVIPVTVTPNTSYQFHAMVKARGANPNMAAVLGMDGQYTVTGSVRTDTEWQPLDLFVKVGQQTTMDVTMGLGHFGQLNVGTAEFDVVTVTQVGAIPDGAPLADLTAVTTAPKPDPAASSTAQGSNKATWVFVGILAVVGTGAALLLMRKADPESTPAEGDPEPSAAPNPAPALKPTPMPMPAQRANSGPDPDATD